MKTSFISNSVKQTIKFGHNLGKLLRGGEILELISDLGGGKTTLVHGLAEGLGSHDAVQSPSFTINFIYNCAHGCQLHHYDFYRLNDPGVVAEQLSESIDKPDVITVIEWADSVRDRLNKPVLKIRIKNGTSSNQRYFEIDLPNTYSYLSPAFKKDKL